MGGRKEGGREGGAVRGFAQEFGFIDSRCN
jgi:hypothetical protein